MHPVVCPGWVVPQVFQELLAGGCLGTSSPRLCHFVVIEKGQEGRQKSRQSVPESKRRLCSIRTLRWHQGCVVTTASTYIMEDPREAQRLLDKVDAGAWISKFAAVHLQTARGNDRATIRLVMLAFVLGSLAVQIPVGRLSDRIDRRTTMRVPRARRNARRWPHANRNHGATQCSRRSCKQMMAQSTPEGRFCSRSSSPNRTARHCI